jgi:murein DD-endopeptidase MepM/ murein hydrolase activator NlpD
MMEGSIRKRISSKHPSMLGTAPVIVLVVLILVACKPGENIVPTPTAESSRVTVTPAQTETVTIPAPPTPTALFVSEEREDPVGAAAPTAAPDPLRFSFPDAGPPPVSAWRPPLYPVPWMPTPNDHFYFARPIAVDEVNWPLADYRYGGVFFENVVHTGVDIPARMGTPVIAAGSGKVIWAGYGLYRGEPGDLTDPYGLAVVIQHDFGFEGVPLFTVYGHLQRVDVTRNMLVERGDVFGLVGQTGKVTGVHLHFEVRLGESDFFTTLNPELWLVPPEGWGVAVARIMDTAGQLYHDEELNFESLQTGQRWKVRPYGGGAANSDPYYRENLVLSDLPAGLYEVWISYAGRPYNLFLEVFPGRVTYFTFEGRNGFSLELPPDPGEGFDPLSP